MPSAYSNWILVTAGKINVKFYLLQVVLGLWLTRALLGYFYNAPHWGAIHSPLPNSEAIVQIFELQRPCDSPGKFVERKKILMTSESSMTSQVRSNKKCLTFPFNVFPPRNDDNKRISNLWIDMIRVCDISKHRPYSEVTFSEVKIIWGHEVKLTISVIWRRSTCLWVGFSSRAQKMTLEHRLSHKTWNKMSIWNYMLLRPNALKSSHFSHSKCYKTPFLGGHLLETFSIHSLEAILVDLFRFLKIWKFKGIFFAKRI